jgi:glutamate racemase
MKIGVFDSGLGGHTILNAIRERLPLYDYIYYGDTKNLPYGDKTEEEIYGLTKHAVIELFERGALLVIIACNTASAESLRGLQDTILEGKYADRRILGVIIPTIETLIDVSADKALLIGTNRTVNSKKYERELAKRNAHSIKLMSIATPELVPLIELGDMNDAYACLDKVLTLRVGEVDTLILGCTHYTVLKEGLRKRFSGLRIISQDELIPEKLGSYLHAHPEIESRLTRGKSCEQIITGEEPGRLNCE